VAAWWDGKLPGSPGFEQNVKNTAENMIHSLFTNLRAEAHKYYAMGPDWAAKWAEQRIREAVAHIKPAVMGGMDEFLAEANALAAFSERGHSSLVQAYSQIKMLVMQGAPEDMRAAQVEAERLVDMTAKLPFVRTRSWTWGYYLLGLAAFVFVANVSATTLTAVILMGEHWHTWHKVGAFATIIPFFGTLAFVKYFWFIACTGNVSSRRLRRSSGYAKLLPNERGSTACRALVQDGGEAPPLGPGGDTHVDADTDGDENDGRLKCCTAVGVIVPLVVALGAAGRLGYQIVFALRTPMYERCLGLMQADLVNTTNTTSGAVAMLVGGF